MTESLDKIRAKIVAKGLNFQLVKSHQELLLNALRRHKRPEFKIIDTCRLDNGGILPGTWLVNTSEFTETQTEPGFGITAFVPAAGAASRYFAPLTSLGEALENKDQVAAQKALTQLAAEGAAEWPLPQPLSALISKPEAAAHLSPKEAANVLEVMNKPKALLPCVKEGVTFLAMKHMEHQQLRGLRGEVFITPPGMIGAFYEELQTLTEKTSASDLPTEYLEQNPSLSSIRFHIDGSPYLEPNGDVSLVPAGHGALASLFPAVKEKLPGTHSLFIRNIDNVTGIHTSTLDAMEHFLRIHQTALKKIQAIRAALRNRDLSDAAKIAASLFTGLSEIDADINTAQQTCLDKIENPAEKVLWSIQFKIFHTQPDQYQQGTEALAALYERPLNTMGQVPNTAHDVGGTPCFLETPVENAADLEVSETSSRKVCIEVPHVSAADKDAFLANPLKATHFNPVFVTTEIADDPAYYSGKNRHFWLMAEKLYRGEPVVYLETILYELLGNSELANTVFLEIPRKLFNPHKALKDMAGCSIKQWLPS